MYIFRGSNCGFFSASLLYGGQLLKERNSFPMSKFLPFRIDTILELLCYSRKQQEVVKFVALEKSGGKHEGVCMHCKGTIFQSLRICEFAVISVA